MQPAEFILARKGGQHLKDENGMLYYLCRRCKKKTYYICLEKRPTLNCPTRAEVEPSTNLIVQQLGIHHDSNLQQQKVRDLENQAIKITAKNNAVPRSVL